MSLMRINPRPLSGRIAIQPSKSAGHRMAICAALAGHGSQVYNRGRSDAIHATLGALRALGFSGLEEGECVLTAAGGRERQDSRTVECGESGSTLRFLIPLALDGVESYFTGRGRLMERPLGPYEAICRKLGMEWSLKGGVLRVQGELPGGVFALPGDVSSQFVSGLLFALPLRNGDSRIVLTSPLQSRGYVDLTLAAMEAFGVHACWEGEDALLVPGGQRYSPAQVVVEGDYSHAAFFAVAGLLGGGTECGPLKGDSRQGDRAVIELLRAMGGGVEWQDGSVLAQRSDLHGVESIHAEQIPDLVPILAVAACAARGRTHITGAARLRAKESDRLAVLAQELSALGANITEEPDGLIIEGSGSLRGGRCDAHNDHRIAMSLAVASSLCREEVLLADFTCVKKSAPDFWQEFAALGGEAEILEGGETN